MVKLSVRIIKKVAMDKSFFLNLFKMLLLSDKTVNLEGKKAVDDEMNKACLTFPISRIDKLLSIQLLSKQKW